MQPEVSHRIEQRIRARLTPEHFELRDDSAKHAGHAGATSGGGHYKLVVVAQAFDGLGPLERHRLVYDALSGMVGAEIHALALKTLTPDEWKARPDLA